MANDPAQEPLVSVLMASYETAAYIAEAIESALAQSYPRLEVVVADDCSSDDTAGIAERYAREHPGRVTVIRGERNLGAWRNRDRALQAARGELLAQLDPDDVWAPDKVERQVRVLRERPQVGLVYTGFELFESGSGERLGDPVRATRQGDVFEALWSEGNFIGALTALWRREAMSRRGVSHLWARGEPHLGDDYNLWLLVAMDWQVAAIDSTLARYRRHPASLTAAGGANPHLVYLRLLRNFARDYPEVRTRLGSIRRRRLARERRLAGAYEIGRGRRLRGAALWAGGFARDPSPYLGPRWERLLTRARVATRPLQPSHWRGRRRLGGGR